MKASRRSKGGPGALTLRVHASEDLALLGAAYLMTQDAYVALGRQGRARTVTLWPKAGRPRAGLAAAFLEEYQNQRLRWSLARAGLGRRRELLGRALASVGEDAAARASDPGLSPEQKEEMARLLAEAEAAPRDPLGIATPWGVSRRRGP